jgi:6-phosphogluconolactonase (cycloisomerase 2 family)
MTKSLALKLLLLIIVIAAWPWRSAFGQKLLLVEELRPSVAWETEQVWPLVLSRSPDLLYASSRDGSILVIGKDEEGRPRRIVQRLIGTSSKRDRTAEVTATELLDHVSIPWMAISPDGRHAYAGDVGFATIIRFERDVGTGKLTPPSWTPREREQRYGRWYPMPRMLVGKYLVDSSNDGAFDPTGRFLYVSSLVGTVAIFEREPDSGKLTFRHVFADEDLVRPGNESFREVNWDKLAVTMLKDLGRPMQVVIPTGSRPIYVMAHTTGSPGKVIRFERSPKDGMLYFRGPEGGPGNDQYGIPFKLVVNSRGNQFIMALRNNGGVVLDREPDHGKLAESSWLPVPGTQHDNTGLESVALSPDDKYLLAFCAAQKKLFLFVPEADGKGYKLADTVSFELPDRDYGGGTDFDGRILPGFRPNEFFVDLARFDCLRVYRVEDGK